MCDPSFETVLTSHSLDGLHLSTRVCSSTICTKFCVQIGVGQQLKGFGQASLSGAPRGNMPPCFNALKQNLPGHVDEQMPHFLSMYSPLLFTWVEHQFPSASLMQLLWLTPLQIKGKMQGWLGSGLLTLFCPPTVRQIEPKWKNMFSNFSCTFLWIPIWIIIVLMY